MAQSFYAVLSDESDLSNLQAQIQILEDRLKVLRTRVRIGRSKKSDVLSTEAELAKLRAQIFGIDSQLAVDRESIQFLTGSSATLLLKDTMPLPSEGLDLEKLITRVPARPDVKAQEEQVASARDSKWIALGAHLPSADATANYYPKRTGALEDVKWDVQLSLSLPIFSGGIVQSQVREADARLEQAELALARARRSAEQEIRSLYATLQQGQLQLKALEDSVKLSDENAKQQLKEYDLGLVTNLDVLNALTTYHQSKQDYSRSIHQLKFESVELQMATAQDPREMK